MNKEDPSDSHPVDEHLLSRKNALHCGRCGCRDREHPQAWPVHFVNGQWLPLCPKCVLELHELRA